MSLKTKMTGCLMWGLAVAPFLALWAIRTFWEPGIDDEERR